ncbi:MAG: dephospho-CoA kinase [Bacteroidetes bacterium]|nr:dephospho-CoA kinase [Bacteroidota bacterium]
MIKIGITGGIGSGKSTVCEVFELLGVPVYYSDEEAKKMLDSDSNVKKSVLALFGNDVLNEQGLLDKKKISAIVFKDKNKLEQLNTIIHPVVAMHFENWVKQHSIKKYILKEAAILFESNAYKQVDKVISVLAPKELRIQRTLQRDKISHEQVEERMKTQMSDEEKIKRSQFVIHNDEQQLLIPQVLRIHEQFK